MGIFQILAENSDKSTISASQILFIGMIVLVAYMMLLSTRKRIQKSKERYGSSAQEIVARKIRQINVSTDQLNELFAALADFSRQVNGQIDTRIIKLQILLNQADEKIAELNNINAKHPQKNQNSAAIDELKDKINQIKSQASQELTDIASNFHQSQGKTIPAENTEVIQLARKGMDKIAIAQQLGRPVGEIELILSLANF